MYDEMLARFVGQRFIGQTCQRVQRRKVLSGASGYLASQPLRAAPGCWLPALLSGGMDEGWAGGWPPGAGAGTVIPRAGGGSSASKEDIAVREEPDSQPSTLSRPGPSTQIGDSRELEPEVRGVDVAENQARC